MKWYDAFFDSCRDSLELSTKNFKLYLPNIIVMIITGVLIFIISIVFIFFGVAAFSSGVSNSMNMEKSFETIIPLIVLVVIIVGIILPIMYCMVEAGILFMSKKISINSSANFSDFFYGLKKYWWQIIIGVNIVGLLLLLLFIPAFIVFSLVDILTFGYGFMSAWTIFNVFFGTWGAIMVIDEISAWEAIKKGYGFGKQNFWALSLIFFCSMPIVGFASVLLKVIPLAGIILAPIAVTIINTYFRLVLVKYYYEVTREKEVLMESVNNY